ncbi:MAG: hypothetical protein ACUVUC_12465 [Thermoguttaceae bacterium]
MFSVASVRALSSQRPSLADLGISAVQLAPGGPRTRPPGPPNARVFASPGLARQRIDPRLARIVDSWAGLPAGIQDALVAMIEAACQKPPR